MSNTMWPVTLDFGPSGWCSLVGLEDVKGDIGIGHFLVDALCPKIIRVSSIKGIGIVDIFRQFDAVFVSDASGSCLHG
jgi:hypothetical protein